MNLEIEQLQESARFAKGYPHWLGWLGLLSCVGLVILFVLPNRCKESGGQGA